MRLNCKVLVFLSLATSTAFAQINKKLNDAKWQLVEQKDLPNARHESCFVEVDNLFYLLGGRKIKPVDIFNPKTLNWKEGAKPPIEIHHFQAVVYKHKIFVFSAMTGKYPHETPLENVYSYNPKTDEWKKEALIPESRRRGSAGVVVDKTKAIIVSGITDGHSSGFVKWMDAYDFETGKWSKLQDAPRPRDHFSAALHLGKIYCVGGRNSSFATNQTFDLTIPEVDVYDIKNKIWSTLPNNLLTQRAAASTVFIGNELLVIGGESVDSDYGAHNEVEALNIKSNTWRTLAPLNIGRHGTQVIKYKNALYTVAGSGKKGGKPELSSMEKLTY